MYSQGLFSIGGIASGLDTSGIIDQLMQLERQPVVRMQNVQSQLKQVDSAWSRVNTKLSALRTAVDAISKPAQFDKMVAVESSNTDAVGVKASGTAGTGSVSFRVTQLAQSHQLASGDFANPDAALAADTFEVTVDGTTTTVTLDGTQSLNDLASELNAAKGGFTASVVKVADGQHRLLLTGNTTGADQALTVSSGLAQLQSTATTDLRVAQDATLELGAVDGDMTVQRSSNTISDLVAGATITLKQTTTDPVTVTASRDVDGAAKKIKAYVDALNGAIGTLADLSGYDAETEQGGVLQGDSTARALLSRLRSAVNAPTSLTSGFTNGYEVGLGIDRAGAVTLDETKLRDALTADFDGVAKLFSTSGTATSASVSSVAGTSATRSGTYEVKISRAATVASITGTAYTPPGDTEPKTFRVSSGGQTVSITIDSTHTTADQAALAIQQKLDEAGISMLSSATAGGELKLETTAYGSAAEFTVEGLDASGNVDATDTVFGLAGSHAGVDVEGSIREAGTTDAFVAMTGSGQLLTAASGDADGLRVQYTGASTETFDVTYSRGLAGNMSDTLKQAEGSGGMVARARQGITSQIDLYQDRIDSFDIRLQTREATLRRQFTAMETAMSQLQSQGNWLSSQLSSLAGLNAQRK